MPLRVGVDTPPSPSPSTISTQNGLDYYRIMQSLSNLPPPSC